MIFVWKEMSKKWKNRLFHNIAGIIHWAQQTIFLFAAFISGNTWKSEWKRKLMCVRREIAYLPRINDQQRDMPRTLDIELRNHNRNFASMRRTADFMNPRTISARNEAIVICAESRTVSRRENIIDHIRINMMLNDQRTKIILVVIKVWLLSKNSCLLY